MAVVYNVNYELAPLAHVTIRHALNINFQGNGRRFATPVRIDHQDGILATHQAGIARPFFGGVHNGAPQTLLATPLMTCCGLFYFYPRIQANVLRQDFSHVRGRHVNSGDVQVSDNPANFNPHNVPINQILTVYAVGKNSKDDFAADVTMLENTFGLAPHNILVYNATNENFAVDVSGALYGPA